MSRLLIAWSGVFILVGTAAVNHFTGWPMYLITDAFKSMRVTDFYLSSAAEPASQDNLYFKKTGTALRDLPEPKYYSKNNYVPLLHMKPDDQKAYQFIADHTFKIQLSCHSTGTGWIMDFEIPKDPNKYPTTFFIATNMHVINWAKFQSNPYNVLLPQPMGGKRECLDSPFSGEGILLSKSTIAVNAEYTESSTNPKTIIATTPAWTTADIKDPKLIYHAINYAGPRHTENGRKVSNQDYFHDFAVVEVTFESEEESKKMTSDIYGKYYKNGVATKKSVNLFSPELLNSSTYDDLKAKKIFTGGYSSSDRDYFSTNKSARTVKRVIPIRNGKDIHLPQRDVVTAFCFENPKETEEDKKAGISFDWLINSHGEPIMGHFDTKNAPPSEWNEKKIYHWGYELIFSNIFIASGDSGSLVMDEDYNFLGVIAAGWKHYDIGFVVPIRSEGIFDGRKIISPKFDLIRGVEGQPMSYKSQLLKYKPNMTTYLTSINWGEGNSGPKTAKN